MAVVAMEGTGAETEEAMGLTETRVAVHVPGHTENTYNYLRLSSVRETFSIHVLRTCTHTGA